MIIRKAVNKDIDEISDLIQKVTDYNPNNYSPEQIVAWKKYNAKSEIKKQLNDRLIFCAIEDNKTIGTIALKENFILGFYVNYSIRNIGIGTKLLDYLEKYALCNNIKKLKLTSTPSAIEFYKKRGYKIKENVTLSIYGVDYPEVEMEKILSAKTYAQHLI
ncbi:GNAT family acetyltransferase [Ulvibacter sp. MAR_2010_11]|uniref:GNAT family N-acetyltransferase n=1 Tax=Ulvibacter sp. MAR_2010_11 TaxID=1250229 RepID=UPI000C2BAD84|nr:GNAT family N-acetyltransferase [Ulvibacter sp. MAR_2010_11]PKA81974.1 GNAT family acetyltransferase [Ulvibacter sp. MAR_2010_11]